MYDALLSHLRSAVPFAGHVGVELVSMGDGAGVARLGERPSGLNHVGTHHAGALFTLGEAASGVAMAGAFASMLLSVRPVAGSAAIDFRRPARGDIEAEAAIIDATPEELRAELAAAGKVRFPIAVTLRNSSGDVVADMRVDWHVSSLAPR